MHLHFIFCQRDILLTSEGNVPLGVEPPMALEPGERVTTIDVGGNTCHISLLSRPPATMPGLRMEQLRASAAHLAPGLYQLAGKCAELAHWHRLTHYCGSCGEPLRWQTPISKQCPRCHREWWPSPAVAVIVRIERDDEILLVRSHQFRGQYYGLVAGFVETGERLEEAVLREVREETGLLVRDLRYYGSQPWPHPFGLMVGFTATYHSGTLSLQQSELADGGWFARDSLPQIPPPASIAREMIEDWLKNGAGTGGES